LGIGTQKVVEELAHTFPTARVLRWDRDATRGRRSHETLLERFVAHEADIMVGTQMVAKGLDLPLVTLVGVINADIGLHLPDFRAGERTFQLLTQVAGRAGRGPEGGKVIIQTYAPEHYAIASAARYDYRGFYEMELSFRRQHGYPPFRRLARLVYSHPNDGRARREAIRLAQCLKEAQEIQDSRGMTVLGPVPPYTRRVRGRYRWQLLLCGDGLSQILDRVTVPLGWTVDLDPMHLL
jgi:primosomal protein N' (replication factor Y)